MTRDGVDLLQDHIARKPLCLQRFAGFSYFSDTKMMNRSKWFACCKMSNFISVIFVFWCTIYKSKGETDYGSILQSQKQLME